MAPDPKDKPTMISKPDGKGGFTDPNLEYPVCPICTIIFERGDSIINIVTDVHPKAIMTSPAHLSCTLAIAKNRILAKESKEVHTDEEPEGDKG